jgi:hypothetical protein
MTNIRNLEFEKLKNFFKNNNSKDLCIKFENKKRVLFNKKYNIVFQNILGKSDSSRDGEVYEIIIANINIAMKIIPLKAIYSNNEINIMNQLNYLVLNNICPHFNLIYHNTSCKHSGNYKFKNKNINSIVNEIDIMKNYNDNISKIIFELSKYSNVITEEKFNTFTSFPKSYDKILKALNLIKKDANHHLLNYKKYNINSLLIFTELSSYDLNTYLSNLTKKKNHTNLISSILKQIIISLRVMHIKEKIIHLDLHSGNIFLNLNDSKGYWSYKQQGAKGETYNIKNEGVHVRIADFGRSYILNSKNSNNKDIYLKLYKQLKRFFPIHYSDDQYLSSFEIFYKYISKNDMNFWINYFDIWRIFSSINNTINKNEILISKNLINDINEVINISQLILTTINYSIPVFKNEKSSNKTATLDSFNRSMYDNFYSDYIFNEKYEMNEKVLNKLKSINKKPYLFV